MTVERGQIVFGCSLLATAVIAVAANAAPRCPSGTRETKQDIGGGSSVDVCVDANDLLHGKAVTRNSDGVVIAEDEWNHGTKVGTWKEWYGANKLSRVTTYVNGAREGAYSEWAPSGKQRVWGWFEQDHEQGPWLFAYDKGGDAIGFVVFDSGIDVTTQMDSPPKTCAEWLKRTSPFRSGVLVTAALEAAKRLPEADRKLITDWPKFGLCLRAGATAAVHEVDSACARANSTLDTIGPSAAAALAARCIHKK